MYVANSRLNKIDKILMSSKYIFFFERSTVKNFRVKRV
jgi:hypothetical protein